MAQTKAAFDHISANCTLFTTGNSFLAEYEAEKYDLVILDVILSDNSGLTILNKLKTQYDAPPIVVYSQSLQKDWVVKVLSSGAKTYLIKPQKPNVLVQKALAVLHGDF